MMLLAQAAEVGAGNTPEVVLFWVFAVLALGTGVAVITMRNIVHGALMLVVNLLSIAGLYLTLESSFLSIIQVIVYAGAIMVLFLFVIMLLGVDNDDLLASEPRTRVLAVLGGALLAGTLLFAVIGPYTTAAAVCGPGAPTAAVGEVDCVGLEAAYGEEDPSGVAFLGRAMFTRYTYAFELSALLLTVATIGAVILARRKDITPEDEDEEDALDGLDALDDPAPAEETGAGAGATDAGDDDLVAVKTSEASEPDDDTGTSTPGDDAPNDPTREG